MAAVCWLQTMPLSGHQALELFAGVLAAPIRAMHPSIRFASPLDGHQKSARNHCAVMLALIDQPTTRRENKSMTADT